MSVALAVEGGVARLTLARPGALNALNREMAAGLERALDAVAASPATAVIIRGEGRAFCAGNDIKEMPDLGPAEAEALSRRWARIMDRFAQLPQVTIAAVHGHALGGGLMLAAAQDLRIAAASARFGLPEVTLGFNPSYGIARLLDVVGGGPARDLLLTGRTIGADEALRIGLVTEVVPDEGLGAAAEALAAHVAGLPRAGLVATKAVVAEVRAGRPGAEAQAYAAALRADAGARARLVAFASRKGRGSAGSGVGPAREDAGP
jgi:enoyl-CoA hydratase